VRVNACTLSGVRGSMRQHAAMRLQRGVVPDARFSRNRLVPSARRLCKAERSKARARATAGARPGTWHGIRASEPGPALRTTGPRLASPPTLQVPLPPPPQPPPLQPRRPPLPLPPPLPLVPLRPPPPTLRPPSTGRGPPLEAHTPRRSTRSLGEVARARSSRTFARAWRRPHGGAGWGAPIAAEGSQGFRSARATSIVSPNLIHRPSRRKMSRAVRRRRRNDEAEAPARESEGLEPAQSSSVHVEFPRATSREGLVAAGGDGAPRIRSWSP